MGTIPHRISHRSGDSGMCTINTTAAFLPLTSLTKEDPDQIPSFCPTKDGRYMWGFQGVIDNPACLRFCVAQPH